MRLWRADFQSGVIPVPRGSPGSGGKHGHPNSRHRFRSSGQLSGFELMLPDSLGQLDTADRYRCRVDVWRQLRNCCPCASHAKHSIIAKFSPTLGVVSPQQPLAQVWCRPKGLQRKPSDFGTGALRVFRTDSHGAQVPETIKKSGVGQESAFRINGSLDPL